MCKNFYYMLVFLSVLVPPVIGSSFSSELQQSDIDTDDVLIAKDDFDYPPYSFLDEDGKPTGFSVELLREVAEVMDLDIKISLDPWSKVRKELETGQIDIVSGMYYSEERDKEVDFSQPHSVTYGSIFARRGAKIESLDDIRGKEIIVLDSDIMHDYVVQHGISDNLIAVPSLTEAFELLAAGQGDCLLTESQQGRYIVVNNELGNIITVGPPLNPQLYCFAVPEGREELLDDLNSGLNYLKASGAYDRLFAKWREPANHRAQIKSLLVNSFAALATLLFVVVVVFAWSWTLRKRVNEKTAQLQKELAERKKISRMLNLKNEELENILYVNSHDLRSPLVNITGFSAELEYVLGRLDELMSNIETPEVYRHEISRIINNEVPQCLHFITSNAQKVDRLQSGLLRLSRLGAESLHLDRIEMNDLVTEAIQLQRANSGEDGGRIKVEELPPCYGDRDQLRLVFYHLIDNAMKYTDRSREAEILISGKHEDSWSTYCVSDKGVGIDPKYREKIFEMFHRLDPASSIGGEGLGLTVVRRILDRLDGKIWVKSEPGEGTDVYISLPAPEKAG